MAEARESSGLHSLAELRRLAAEESRKQAESAQRARLVAERERARIEQERADHERALRAAAESGLHAEIERLEQARLEESAHTLHEAKQRRELELALVEAQNRLQQSEVVRIDRAARARVWLAASWTSTGAVVLAAACAYLGVVRPDSFARRAELASTHLENAKLRLDEEAIAARDRAREAALDARVSELERALRDARSASVASRSSATSSARAPHGHGEDSADTASRKPCRDDGDPLNPCLKR